MNKFLVGSILCLVSFNAYAMNQSTQVISPNDDQQLRDYLRRVTPYYQNNSTSPVPPRQLESPTPLDSSSEILPCATQSAPEPSNKSLSLSKGTLSPAAQSAPARIQTAHYSIYPIPSIAKILVGGSILGGGVSTPDLCKASALLSDIRMDNGEESINALIKKSNRTEWLEDNNSELPLTCTVLSYYLNRGTSNNWALLQKSLKNPRRKKSNSIG